MLFYLANCGISLIFVAANILYVSDADRTLHRRGDAKFNSRQITLFWEAPNFIAAKICWFTVCHLYFSIFGPTLAYSWLMGRQMQHGMTSLPDISDRNRTKCPWFFISLSPKPLCHMPNSLWRYLSIIELFCCLRLTIHKLHVMVGDTTERHFFLNWHFPTYCNSLIFGVPLYLANLAFLTLTLN